MNKKYISSAVFLLTATAASFAAPTIFNASFETPDTVNESWEPTVADQGGTGWEFAAGAFHAGVVQDNNVSFADYAAADGTQMGSLWCGGDEIAQNIGGFVIGETYQIQWSERARQGYTGSLWVLMDGVTVEATHAVSDASWVAKSIDFTATAETHRLRFFHSGAWDTMTHIDNVSIIPEPGTYVLIGGMLSLAVVMLRRRR